MRLHRADARVALLLSTVLTGACSLVLDTTSARKKMHGADAGSGSAQDASSDGRTGPEAGRDSGGGQPDAGPPPTCNTNENCPTGMACSTGPRVCVECDRDGDGYTISNPPCDSLRPPAFDPLDDPSDRRSIDVHPNAAPICGDGINNETGATTWSPGLWVESGPVGTVTVTGSPVPNRTRPSVAIISTDTGPISAVGYVAGTSPKIAVSDLAASASFLPAAEASPRYDAIDLRIAAGAPGARRLGFVGLAQNTTGGAVLYAGEWEWGPGGAPESGHLATAATTLRDGAVFPPVTMLDSTSAIWRIPSESGPGDSGALLSARWPGKTITRTPSPFMLGKGYVDESDAGVDCAVNASDRTYCVARRHLSPGSSAFVWGPSSPTTPQALSLGTMSDALSVEAELTASNERVLIITRSKSEKLSVLKFSCTSLPTFCSATIDGATDLSLEGGMPGSHPNFVSSNGYAVAYWPDGTLHFYTLAFGGGVRASQISDWQFTPSSVDRIWAADIITATQGPSTAISQTDVSAAIVTGNEIDGYNVHLTGYRYCRAL